MHGRERSIVNLRLGLSQRLENGDGSFLGSRRNGRGGKNAPNLSQTSSVGMLVLEGGRRACTRSLAGRRMRMVMRLLLGVRSFVAFRALLLLLPVRLARQILFSLHPNIHFG